jgi:AcrR family transcriptional regulator
MPRQVNHEARRQDILDAVIATLADGGFEKLTLRSLAERLGGSITLVTHYFPTKDALITAALSRVFAEAQSMVEQLSVIEDPDERLTAVLHYFLPIDEESHRLERARVAMVVQKDGDPTIAEFFERLEPAMRAVIRAGIETFYPEEDVDRMVDVFRAWTSGVALSAVEHPELWTPDRQLAVLDTFLSYVTVPRKGVAARR